MFDKKAEVELKVPAHTSYIPDLRNIIGKVGKARGFSDKVIEPLKLAMEEAAVNIIKHGYDRKKGYIHMKIKVRKSGLTVTLVDRGTFFDPRLVPSLDLVKYVEQRKKGGLGIVLIRRLLDRIDYRRTTAGNELSLTKYYQKPKTSDCFRRLTSVSISLCLALIFYLVPSGLPDALNAAIAETELQPYQATAQQKCYNYYTRGFESYKQGQYDQALNRFEQALNCYTQLQQGEMIVECMKMKGEINRQLEKSPAAVTIFQETLNEIASRGLSGTKVEADVHKLLAWTFQESDDNQRAIAHFESALQLYIALVIPEGEADCHYGLGLLYLNNEQYKEAASAFQQARDLFEILHKDDRRINCIYYIGKCQYLEGEYDSADSTLTSYLQIGADSIKRANSYFWLGSIYLKQEQYQEAITEFRSADSLFQQLSEPLMAAHCSYNMGLSYANLKEWNRAGKVYEEAARLYRSISEFKNAVLSLQNLGHVNFNSEQYAAAVAAYKKAADLAELHGFRSEQPEILESLGDSYAALDSLDRAVTAYGSAAQLSDKREDAIDIYLKKGEIHLQLDQSGAAIISFRNIKLIASRTPVLRRPLADSHFNLAEVLYKIENCEEALPEYEKALSLYRELNAGADTLAQCLDGQGHCNFDRKLFAEAALHFTEAASKYQSSGELTSAANAHYNAGSSYNNLKDRYHEALEHYQAAFALYEQLNLSKNTANAQSRLASVYVKLENRNLALEHFRSALKIYNNMPDTAGMSGKAECYSGMGAVYSKLEPKDLSKAENSYKKGQELYVSIGDSSGWADCHRGLASVHFEQKLWSIALPEYQAAGETFEHYNQPDNAALCFQNAGSAAYNLKDYPKALRFYQRALDYSRSNSKEAASLHKHIGDVNLALFELGQAWHSYENGLALYTDIDDTDGIFYCSIGLGDIYFNRGQYSQAKARYDEARSRIASQIKLDLEAITNQKLSRVAKAVGKFEQAVSYLHRNSDIYGQLSQTAKRLETLMYLGLLYYHSDQYQDALKSFGQVYNGSDDESLTTFRRSALINKGNVYHAVGSYDQAAMNYQQALKLAKSADDKDHISASLTGLGNVLLSRENPDYAEAEETFKEVLTIAEEQNDAVDMARALLNLGNVYNAWQQNQVAENHYVRSRKISEQENFTEGVAISFNNIGIVELNRGSNPAALENFQRAQEKAEEIYLKRLRITAYANQGVTYENMARYQEARNAYEQAINLVEEIRGGFKRKDDLFNSYVESTVDLYDRMITLLSENGDHSTAYKFVEHFVSRDIDLFNWWKEKAVDDSQLTEYLNQLENARDDWQASKNSVKNFNDDYPTKPIPGLLVRTLASNAAKVDSLQRVLKMRYPDFPGRVEILPARISQIQHRIPRGAIVVTYYASRDKLYIFIASSERHVARSVAISRNELHNKINQYRRTLLEQRESAIQTDWNLSVESWQDKRVLPLTRITTELYRYLISPLIDVLERAQTIIFMPTGLLSYLPLHGLAKELDDGTLKFVIEDWKVAYITSATFTNSITNRYTSSIEECRQNVSAIGYSGGPLPLPGVAKEMKYLKQFAPMANIFEDQAATVDNAIQASKESCIFVISSHVNVNQSNTNLSCFELKDGALCIGDINKVFKSGELASMNLAIFPNCETALGEENPKFGVNNIVYAFCQKGAASVMATLWKVSDYFTPYLMHEFYRNFFDRNMDKAESLRQAQITLLQNPQTRHPFLWAPFLLYGYWFEDVIELTNY